MTAQNVIDVLVIDDDPDMCSIFADLLSIEGYSVETASNGIEAMRRLGTPQVPGLIVLDLLMPLLNGTDFLRIRSRYPRWSTVPVIVLTGQQSPNLPESLGVSAVLTKPPDIQRLLGLIRQLCPPSSSTDA